MWRIVRVSLNVKEFIVVFYVWLGFLIIVGETLEVTKDWKKCMDGSTRGGILLIVITVNGRWRRMGRQQRWRQSHAGFGLTIALIGISIGTTRIRVEVIKQVPSLSYRSKAMRTTVWHRLHGRAGNSKGNTKVDTIRAWWSPKCGMWGRWYFSVLFSEKWHTTVQIKADRRICYWPGDIHRN